MVAVRETWVIAACHRDATIRLIPANLVCVLSGWGSNWRFQEERAVGSGPRGAWQRSDAAFLPCEPVTHMVIERRYQLQHCLSRADEDGAGFGHATSARVERPGIKQGHGLGGGPTS